VLTLTPEVSAVNLASYIQTLTAFTTRFAAYKVNDNPQLVANVVQGMMETAGLTGVIQQRWDDIDYGGDPLTYGTYTVINVIGEIMGKHEPDKIIVVTCHHDCYVENTLIEDHALPSPGAVDNASGVALMMEMIRIIKASGYEPRYTIRFVSTTEEEGHWGADFYSAQIKARGDDVIVNFNLDGVFYNEQLEAAYAAKMHYYDTDTNLVQWTRMKAALLGYGGLSEVVAGTQNWTGQDSYNFYEDGYASMGIRCNDDYSAYMHTADDDEDIIDYDYAVFITKGVLGGLLQVAGLS
jgi:bacterial leucyl aminopeptidase